MERRDASPKRMTPCSKRGREKNAINRDQTKKTKLKKTSCAHLPVIFVHRFIYSSQQRKLSYIRQQLRIYYFDVKMLKIHM